MVKIFELDNKMDREFGKEKLAKIDLQKLDDELKSQLLWQIKYVNQLSHVYDKNNACSDKLVIYGNPVNFTSRIEKASELKSEEVYDIEEGIKNLKRQEYEIVGGLGGFSLDNGNSAGELIMLPGGMTIRAELRSNKHFAQNVPPINIYPMALFTGRKQIEKPNQNTFFVIFEKGEMLTDGIEEVTRKVNDKKKTITGSVIGNFTDITGYMFTQASPRTILPEFELNEKKNFFVYQTFLGENVENFQRVVHSHGFEAARVMDKNAFGAHLYNAKVVDVAIGIFGVAEEIERH